MKIMKIMKILILFFSTFFSLEIIGQGNFIRLGDFSGLQPNTEETNNLNSISDSLVEILKPYTTDFAIYESGLYSYNVQMPNGIQNVTDLTLSKITKSNYVLIERIHENGDVEATIVVKCKFPNVGHFQCIYDGIPDFDEKVAEILVSKISNHENIYDDIHKGLKDLKTILKKRLKCCEIRSSCPICIENTIEIDGELFYDDSQLFDDLIKKGFYAIPVIVTEDNEFIQPDPLNTFAPSTIGKERFATTLGAKVKFSSHENEIDLDVYFSHFKSDFDDRILTRTGVAIEHNIYYFKFPRDYCLFESQYSAFEADNGDSKTFIAFISAGSVGTIFFKTGSNVENFERKKNVEDRFSPANDIREEEYEQFKKLYHEEHNTYFADPCGNYLFTHATEYTEKAYAELSNFLTKHNDDKLAKKHLNDNYQKINNTVKKAKLVYDLFFHREYAIVDKEKGQWALTPDYAHEVYISMHTRKNLCITLIHSALDACGLAWPGCDAINAALYVTEGKFGMAALSAAAVIPLVGESKYVTVFTNGIRKTSSCAVGGGRSNSCKTISYFIKNGVATYTDEAHALLKRYSLEHYETLKAINAFRVFHKGMSHVEWHHVLPWSSFLGKQSHILLELATQKGIFHSFWAQYNSLPLPKFRTGSKRFLEDGTDALFHANAPAFKKWIDLKLDEIWKNYGEKLPPDSNKVLNDLIKLTDDAKDEIVKAWENSNGSLNDYFKTLIK